MQPVFSACLLIAALSLGGCGSSDDATAGEPGPTEVTDPMGMTDGTPDEPSDDTGDLPSDIVTGQNGTMPCEPLESGFAGDEVCILPPEPGTGLHMHVGPDDYDNPDEVAPYLLPAGEEATDYYRFYTDNAEVVQFYAQHYRMRPGSHHLITYMLLSGEFPQEGWDPDPLDNGAQTMPIGGSQRSVSDFPPGGEVPPEDANLARPILPNTGMSFEMHFVNTSADPILREAWVNFMATDSPTPEILGGIFMIGSGFEVPPGDTQVLNYTATLAEPEKRVVSLFGHRHANAARFTVWAHRDGVRELVYEDYNWDEPAELSYNTLVDNGEPDEASLTPGGYSGILTLLEGDALEWECEVVNNQDVTLTFGDQVYTGEMCNLFGSAAGGEPFWRESPPLVQK